MHTQIVSPQWLAAHLEDPGIRVVDCRFVLGSPQTGREAYLQDHIPGAVYMDLETDLSSPKGERGGRHPLPDIALFVQKLGQAGISRSVKLVAYDDQGGAMASRFWWLMKYVGHPAVSVLDGGYADWKRSGYPVTAEIPAFSKAAFEPRIQTEMVAVQDEVKRKLHKPGVVLIDSREAKRYLGLEEPIDPVAGHIPGAVNCFWKDSLTEQGNWKPAEQQAARFADLRKADEVIVYCGSGVTACPNILALMEAGFENVKLYAGSWSDWCSDPGNPVEREKASPNE